MLAYAIIAGAVGASLLWAGIQARASGNTRDSRFMAIIGTVGCSAGAALLLVPA